MSLKYEPSSAGVVERGLAAPPTDASAVQHQPQLLPQDVRIEAVPGGEVGVRHGDVCCREDGQGTPHTLYQPSERDQIAIVRSLVCNGPQLERIRHI